jgi:hypothetical protein
MPPAPTPPATPYAVVRRLLTDAARCPGCTAALTRSRCDACGLDLSGAPGQQLWDLSRRAADALSQREVHLQAMRVQQTAREATLRPAFAAPQAARPAAQVADPSSQTPAPGQRIDQPARAVVSGSLLAVAHRPATTPASLVPRAVRPHWRVQTVLQVLGASLLAAASIVFLVFSWGWIGLTGRAVTVAVGTVVVFVLADRLRRAALRSSAEAIGALGTVMLLLDTWAVAATGLVDVTEPSVYAAAACLVCAALLLVGGRGAQLRVTTIVGTALLPLAPALLIPLATGPGGRAWFLVASVTLAGARFVLDRSTPGVTSPQARAWLEPTVLTGAAWLATVTGALLAVSGVLAGQAGDDSAAVGALAAFGALAGLQTWLTRNRATADRGRTAVTGSSWWLTADSATWWAAGAGALIATAAAAAAGVAGAQLDVAPGFFLALVPCGSAVVAAASTARARRDGLVVAADHSAATRGQAPTPVADAAADSALVVALGIGAPAVLVLPFAAVVAAIEPGGAGHDVLSLASLAGAAVVAALLALAVRPSPVARAARQCAMWLAAAVVLAAPAATGAAIPRLVGTGAVVLSLLIGAVAYRVDRRSLHTPVARALLRAPLRALSALAVPGALVATHGSPWLVAATFAAFAALALGVRPWLVGRGRARRGARAGAAAVAVVATWGAVLVGFAAADVRSPLGALLAAAVGLVLVTTAALSPDARWHRLDRCTTLATTTVLAATGWTAGLVAFGRGGQPPALAAFTVLVAVLAAAAVIGVLVGGTDLLGDRARRVAGTFFAPVATGGVVSLHLALRSHDGTGLAAGIAAVGASSVLLALPLASAGAGPRRTPDAVLRLVLEVTGWVTASAALLVAVPTGPGGLALVLLVGAITAGAWSLRPDRRAARWGVLVLGVAASWVLLSAGDVGTPEAYLAPAGLVLTVVGARRRRHGAPDDVPLLAAGLALAMVPTAVLDGILAGRVPRVGVTLVVGALVVLIGLRLRPATAPADGTAPRQPLIDATHVLLAIGLLVVVLGPARHALSAAIAYADGSAPHPAAFGAAAIEAWSGATALVVATAMIRLARLWPTTRYSPRTWGWWLVAAVAVTPSLVAVDGTATGFVRWTLPLAIGGALAVQGARAPGPGHLAPRQPATGRVDRTPLLTLGLTLGGAAALVAAVRSPLPADVPFAILGAVVTAAGVARWRRTPFTAPWLTAPWPLVGPLLLLPAALDQQGVWRTPAVLAGALVLVAIGLRLAPRAPDDGHKVAAPDGGVRAQQLLLVSGAMLAVAGPGVRATMSALGGADPARLLAVEAWSMPAAALIAVAVLALVRTWPDVVGAPLTDPRRWGLALVLTTAAAPTLFAVDASVTGLVRVLTVVAVGAGLAVGGTLAAGGARRDLGLYLAGASTVAWTLRDGPEPADLPIVIVGCLLLVVGSLDMTAARLRSSWRALGLGLVVTLVVPLATGWAHPTAWRLLLVLVGAVVAVLVGAVRRWRAPFAIGGVVLILLALVQLSPAAVAALRVVEWWMLLAIGGAILLGLGLTYERRLREAKEAVRFVAGMC